MKYIRYIIMYCKSNSYDTSYRIKLYSLYKISDKLYKISLKLNKY